MRHLMGFDRLTEALRLSVDVRRMLSKLTTLHDDKVAGMLSTIEAQSGWPDYEDMNLITTHGDEGAAEIHFLPKGRRPPDIDIYNYMGRRRGVVQDLKSQPIKPGKFAEAVLSRVFPRLGPIAARGEFRSNKGGKGIFGDSAAYTLVVPTKDLGQVPEWVSEKNVLPWTLRVEFESRPLLGKAVRHKLSAKVKNIYYNEYETGPIYKRREIRCLALEFDTKYKELKASKSNRADGCSLTDIKLSLEAFDGRDIELFSSRVTSILKNEPTMRMDLVAGEGIRKWYDAENTRKDPTGRPRFTSCLSHPHKADFLDLYCENPRQVSLLTMRDEAGMLVGRALVWKLSHHPTGKKFYIDRIYAADPVLHETFVAYAAERGWETSPGTAMEVRLDRWQFKHWPFVDTMCYLDDETGRLMNEKMHTEDRPEGSWWLLRGQNGERAGL